MTTAPRIAFSALYDHNPDHYRFARVHTGKAPEPIQPVTGWGRDFVRLSGVVVCVALLAGLFAWVMA